MKRQYKRMARSRSSISTLPESSLEPVIFNNVKMWQISIFVYLLLDISSADQSVKVCENDQCQVAAGYINSMMNKTVDPCSDFYSYVCGSWEVNYPRPNGEDIWNIEKLTEKNVLSEIKAILEEEESSDDFVLLKYEKRWFKSCMDIDKIEEIGIQPLMEIVDRFGGWPIIMNNTDWSDHDLQSIIEYYGTLGGISPFFIIYVSTDDRNSTNNAIKLHKPSVTFLEIMMRNRNESVFLSKYAGLIKKVALAFGRSANSDIPEDQLEQDVQDILNFMEKIRQAKTSVIESENFNASSNYMTIEDLQRFCDEGDFYDEPIESIAHIDWLQVLSAIFDGIEGVTISPMEEIRVEDKFYFRNLVRLLNETPNRILINYIHWNFIVSSLEFTNKEMRDLLLETIETSDVYTNSPLKRSEECRRKMIPFGYRYEHARRHLSEENRNMTSDIAYKIRSEMLDEMEHAQWLDDVTKEDTMEKLLDLKWKIAPWQSRVQSVFLKHIYDGLQVGSNYFENVQNIRRFLLKSNLEQLRSNPSFWSRYKRMSHSIRMNPISAKIFYDRARNVLIFTSTQLAVPLLHHSLPLSVNYGYIGPTIGQLMSKTLEKKVGTYTYIPPWSTHFMHTYRSYEPKIGCLVEQYRNYSIGSITLNENMYDSIGLKAAYSAFRMKFNDKNIQKLPGLEDFSDDQLFFISYAAKYCQTSSEKYQTAHNPLLYTPNKYRVIGTLSNSDNFAEAFSCSPGSPMNPINKCII